jgi:cyclopropane fatty-acyl-phospholipid synthase-like methyltransferase
MNWKAKVAVQSVLAHLPFGERANHLLQKASHRYTPERLQKRVADVKTVVDYLERLISFAGATVVEVGSGWELIAPLVMVARGAETVHTYDLNRHLRPEIARQVAEIVPVDFDSAMRRIQYHAPSDAANTGLAEKSVDLFYSYEVFEHVSQEDIHRIVAESRRVLKPSGIAYHAIGLGDHYAQYGVSNINFLKYSDRTWGFWVQNRISYHNRLREKEFLQIFGEHGARILDVRSKTSEADLTLLKSGFKPDRKFAFMEPEELAPWYTEIVTSFPV